MKKEQLADRIGNIDDRLVQEAGQFRRKRRRVPNLRGFGAIAAVLVLMFGSGTIGAAAFSRETIVEVPVEVPVEVKVEVPVEQEIVRLEEIDLALVFPDSWKGRYEVVESVFEPTGTKMWKICVKSIYDTQAPLCEGLLFSVLQCEDYSMSAEEFRKTSPLAGMGRYLFAAENATYAIWYATDVQYDDSDPVLAQKLGEEYRIMTQEMKDIKVILPGAIGEKSAPDITPSSEQANLCDIDHDGEWERWELKSDAAQELWTLQIVEEDGTVCWTEEAHTAHTGWNSIFLCRVDGMDYLLRYHPNMFQGYADYEYQVFYLKDGEEKILAQDSLEFDVNWMQEGHRFDPETIAAFADGLNNYLLKGKLLMSTDEAVTEWMDPEKPYEKLEGIFAADGIEYDDMVTLRRNLKNYQKMFPGNTP